VSARNGDKARFGRQRKSKIRKRIRMRELRKAAPAKARKAGA
jgi:hypothetical protein